MKKLIIYYYVGGEKYNSIPYEEAQKKDLLFTYDEYLFFRRDNSSNQLEIISRNFKSRNDPLFEIIYNNKMAYIIWEEIE